MGNVDVVGVDGHLVADRGGRGVHGRHNRKSQSQGDSTGQQDVNNGDTLLPTAPFLFLAGLSFGFTLGATGRPSGASVKRNAAATGTPKGPAASGSPGCKRVASYCRKVLCDFTFPQWG
ncbi:MAG: hypothetical protein M0Z82_01445 [Actinomycetota bacterium]|nr:hypothetical protein [Actinomycetota bacterium]